MENPSIKMVGEYARGIAATLVDAGDIKGIFRLGTAWGAYSAIEILDGDFHVDAELKQKFIEAYLEGNDNKYFADLIRVHKTNN